MPRTACTWPNLLWMPRSSIAGGSPFTLCVTPPPAQVGLLSSVLDAQCHPSPASGTFHPGGHCQDEPYWPESGPESKYLPALPYRGGNGYSLVLTAMAALSRR